MHAGERAGEYGREASRGLGAMCFSLSPLRGEREEPKAKINAIN